MEKSTIYKNKGFTHQNFLKKISGGFTLLELLLYVSLAAIFLLSVSVLLSILLEGWVKNKAVGEVEQGGERAMQIMTQTIRNADAINSP